MSQCYRAQVTVRGYNPKKEKQIKAAAEEQWGFEQWYTYPASEGGEALEAGGDENVVGEVSEVALDIARAIKAANGALCEVEVNFWWLEREPDDTFVFAEEKDFEEGASQEA